MSPKNSFLRQVQWTEHIMVSFEYRGELLGPSHRQGRPWGWGWLGWGHLQEGGFDLVVGKKEGLLCLCRNNRSFEAHRLEILEEVWRQGRLLIGGELSCWESGDERVRERVLHPAKGRGLMMEGHRISFFLSFFFLVFLGLYPLHIEVPRLWVQSELQLPAYTIAIAVPDPRRIFDLHHSSLQCQILNPLSEWG